MAIITFQIQNALNVIDMIINLNIEVQCHFSQRSNPANLEAKFQVKGSLESLRQLQAELLKNNQPIGHLSEA